MLEKSSKADLKREMVIFDELSLGRLCYHHHQLLVFTTKLKGDMLMDEVIVMLFLIALIIYLIKK